MGTSTPVKSREREAQAIEIAADFARDQDVERAQARLRALGLPNPPQWLAALAERYIREGKDPVATDQLISLSNALGVKTVAIARYMAERSAQAGGPGDNSPAEPMITPTPIPSPPVEPTPTFTPTPTALPTPTSTPTPIPTPFAVVQVDVLNVRAGPSTAYPVVGRLVSGETVEIVGKNPAADWWQVCCPGDREGWVYGPLVQADGALEEVKVATDIPPPPPTPTPLPPTPTPVPQPQVDFRVASTRLLSIQENGGCVGMHNIFVQVVDAAGRPLDGIPVGRVWVPEDVKVTGADNKGPGRAVFDLFKHGDQVRVLNFSSETTRPLEVEDEKIPIPELINAGYCPNQAECQRLINENRLCRYHYSWEVVFQRTW